MKARWHNGMWAAAIAAALTASGAVPQLPLADGGGVAGDIERVLAGYQEQLRRCRTDAERAEIHYRIGSDLLAANRPAEAAAAFRRALQLGGAGLAVAALNQAASAYMRVRNYGALIDVCHSALARHADNENVRAAARFHAGRAFETRGAPSEAIAEYEALLATCPESLWRSHAAQLLANLHISTGDLAAAETVVAAELARNPDNVTLALRLTTVLERRGDIGGATALCERLLSDRPEAETIAKRLYQLKKQHGGLEAYIAGLRAQLEGWPADTVLRRRLADLHMWERRYADAVAQYEKLLAAFPDDAALHQRVAWLHQQEGDLQEARRHYEAAVALQPENVSLYSALGDVCMRLGDDAAAVEALKRASAYQPDDPRAITRYGQLLYQRGRYDLALQTYSEARQRLGEKTAFAQQMAKVREALLDSEGAVEEYLMAAIAACAETDPIPAAAFSAAELAEAEGKLPFLIEKAEALLQEHPGNTALVAVLARAYARSGALPKAAELLAGDGALARTPRRFVRTLAQALLERGDAAAAAELFGQIRASADDTGENAEVALGLARAQAAQGQWQAAADTLEGILTEGSLATADQRVLFELAEIYLQHVKKIERARTLYEAVRGQGPLTRHRVASGIADCLFALGEHDQAAQRYAAIGSARSHVIPPPPPPPPPFADAPRAPVMRWPAPVPGAATRARYMVAECAFRSGNVERAAELFEQFADDAPGSPEANDALRRLQVIRSDMAIDPDGAERFIAALNRRDLGAYERARQAIEELMAAKPRGPLADEGLMLLASILAEEGKIADARSAYERLIATQPDSGLRAEAILAVGRLCEEGLADERGAALQYRRLLREYPHSPLAAQARIRLEELSGAE